MNASTLYRPPAPTPSSPLRSLLRVIRQGDGDLLSLVPREAYEKPLTWLGYSRRSILLINDTALCKEVLNDKDEIFPKNDLMVGALEGLVGNSLFVSSGATWRRQRRMIDPAFSQLRINTAFESMCAAVDDYEQRLDKLVESGDEFSLDQAMSHLTADIICRSIFSQTLDTQIARDVFDDFLLFERSVASVDLKQLIIGKPWARIRQPQPVVDACRRIRKHIGSLLDPRLADDAQKIDDIVAAVINAKDSDTSEHFTREELIDQIGVFFLAGHETTASVLTWVFFILSQQHEVADRIADDVNRVTGGEPIRLEHIRLLPYVKNVFRETLRLYPPITFLPRVALKSARISDKKVKRGAMIMISPWTAHRNSLLWRHADCFDPDRFDSECPRKSDVGVHLSFGVGPRVCVGASFATTEAILIIARLAQRYRFVTQNAHRIRPVARLTTRPAEEIQMQALRR
ncbi:MAG: cytochrome P450 [Granulosicoccus sp.]|nr:cytochrome P450 [Granulosicoccus sp.]